ncbi:MAG: helix-hairpin-helix domain-containing protein [Leadbetterella sp.]|nr:helix-hairpin-helix domain-containing protein [Leadbetterella sp.]
MKRLINTLREHFELTHNEAKSALIFFAIILVNLLLYYSYSTSTVNKQREILIEDYGQTELPEPEERKSKWTDFSTDKKSAKTFEKFNFDPNIASEDQLTRLGFPKYLSKTMVKYRSKGGKFKYKEDLLKIYSMKPELYAEIENLVLLPSKMDKKVVDFEEQRVFTEPKTPVFTKKEFSISKFDINTADTSQLMQIRGIGKVFANRIIKYRDILGGFHTIEQVGETYGIDPNILPELKKVAVLGSPIKKIKINELENFRHPYLKFNQVKVILAYRKQNGNFKNAENLKEIKILDDETISKIGPYLEF